MYYNCIGKNNLMRVVYSLKLPITFIFDDVIKNTKKRKCNQYQQCHKIKGLKIYKLWMILYYKNVYVIYLKFKYIAYFWCST